MNEEAATSETRPSKTIFALLFVIPIFAVLLYGGTDVSALIPLSLLTATFAGIWIVRMWRSGVLALNTNTIQLPLIALFTLGVIQLLPLGDPGAAADSLSASVSHSLSMEPYWTQIFLVRLVGYLLFFAAALTFIDSESRYKKAIGVIITFGALLAFVGILQKLATPDAIYGMIRHSGAIPFGPYINSHHFAALMVLISGVAIAQLLGNGVTRQTKLLIGMAAVIMAIAVPFTGSRGGVIAYIAMLAVAVSAWFYRGGERKSLIPILGGGVALLLVVVSSLVYLGGESSMLRGIGLGSPSDDISSGRFHFWSVAWKIFLANPILGTGLDSFGAAFTKFDTQSGSFRIEQAHNDYLQILSDGGLVGFAIVLAFVVLLVWKALERIRTEENDLIRTTVIGCLAGCVGILVHSLVDFPLRTAGNAFFFLLVIAVMMAPISLPSSERGRSRLSSRREP